MSDIVYSRKNNVILDAGDKNNFEIWEIKSKDFYEKMVCVPINFALYIKTGVEKFLEIYCRDEIENFAKREIEEIKSESEELREIKCNEFFNNLESTKLRENPIIHGKRGTVGSGISLVLYRKGSCEYERAISYAEELHNISSTF